MEHSRGPDFTTGYEHLTLWQRLLRVLYAPRSSFEAVRGEQSSLDWFVPVLILVFVSIGSNYLTLSVVANPDLPAFQEMIEGLTAEERQRAEEGSRRWQSYGWLTTPIVSSFFTLVVVALSLMALARLIFRTEAVTLRQMMTLKGYASVIAMLELIVRTPLVLTYETPEVSLSIGALLSPEMSSTALGRILDGSNAFDLWQACVLGVGLSAMTRAPLARCIAGVVIMWGIWVTSGAALTSLGTPPP